MVTRASWCSTSHVTFAEATTAETAEIIRLDLQGSGKITGEMITVTTKSLQGGVVLAIEENWRVDGREAAEVAVGAAT